MALHTIVIDVPELFHPDDVEAEITNLLEGVVLIKGAATALTVVEYHREKMTEDPDCNCDAPGFSPGAHHAKDCPMRRD
jgi:hypothetical protein